MNSKKKSFLLVFLLFGFSLIINMPKEINFNRSIFGKNIKFSLDRPQINWQFGRFKFQRDLDIKQGLDLQGGVRLVLEADMTGLSNQDWDQALSSARSIVARRIDLYGVSEPVIQTIKSGRSYRIIVELPGAEDVSQAIALIGQTAQLDFRVPTEEQKQATPSAQAIFDFQPTNLTGQHLKKAQVQFSQNGKNAGQPVVVLKFDEQGREKFAQITQKNIGYQVAIFLDQIPLTAPVVKESITDGEALISGNFNIDLAKQLVIQLNAGALPVPLKVVEQENIGPSLGQKAVKKSLQAGLVGLGLLMVFMIGVYGRLGFVSNLALIVYGLFTLSIYKLLPITLTLPGLAGFILSVGMAVDANILTFERFKQEVRSGRPKNIALELSFGKTWLAIKDANICTLIICFILFNPFDWSFLNTSGMIRGFALTLFLGVVISLFTGLVVTRTFLRLFGLGGRL